MDDYELTREVGQVCEELKACMKACQVEIPLRTAGDYDAGVKRIVRTLIVGGRARGIAIGQRDIKNRIKRGLSDL